MSKTNCLTLVTLCTGIGGMLSTTEAGAWWSDNWNGGNWHDRYYDDYGPGYWGRPYGGWGGPYGYAHPYGWGGYGGPWGGWGYPGLYGYPYGIGNLDNRSESPPPPPPPQ